MQLELQILENSKDSKLQVRGEESFESREWCIKKKSSLLTSAPVPSFFKEVPWEAQKADTAVSGY